MQHPASPSANWLVPSESEHSDPYLAELEAWHERAAVRLKEALSSVPFYAKRAAKAAAAGDEMDYWRDLQMSEATLERPSKGSSTPDPRPVRSTQDMRRAA